MTPSGFDFAQGTVSRVIGRFEDEDVTTSTSSAHGGDAHRTAQVFVNRSRSYAVLFEMDGRTYKLEDGDHIALVPGDQVRLVHRRRDDGMRIVADYRNDSRDLRRWLMPSVLETVAAPLFMTLILTVLVGVFASSGGPESSAWPTLLAGGATMLAGTAYTLSLARTASRQEAEVAGFAERMVP